MRGYLISRIRLCSTEYLSGLLYMGVPVAQSMFAGASLITTYLLSAPTNKSLMSPASLDEAARFVLINILQFLNSLSDGKVRLEPSSLF